MMKIPKENTKDSKMKPTKKEYQELKEFKKRVGLEAYNAIQLLENNRMNKVDVFKRNPHAVEIGNATFTFYPNLSMKREDVDKLLKRFTTTKW